MYMFGAESNQKSKKTVGIQDTHSGIMFTQLEIFTSISMCTMHRQCSKGTVQKPKLALSTFKPNDWKISNSTRSQTQLIIFTPCNYVASYSLKWFAYSDHHKYLSYALFVSQKKIYNFSIHTQHSQIKFSPQPLLQLQFTAMNIINE